jgi:large subunit ribosomal protein LP2
MKYLAAYCLATLGGNASPSADDVKKILESVGVNVDDAQLEKAISALKGKNLQDVTPSNLII